MNRTGFIKLINDYLYDTNGMIVIYICLVIIHVIICGAVSVNGYVLHHIELSVIMIGMNIMNVGYYLFIRKSLNQLFGTINGVTSMVSYIKQISLITYIDSIVNLVVLIITTVLFILWIKGMHGSDKNIFIFEYIVNIGVNITTLCLCLKNIIRLNKIFHSRIPQLSNQSIGEPLDVNSPMYEI